MHAERGGGGDEEAGKGKREKVKKHEGGSIPLVLRRKPHRESVKLGNAAEQWQLTPSF